MHKRGQVTVFIILGILILLVVGSIFLFISDSAKRSAEVEAEKVQQAIQMSASIKSYVESCLNNVGTKGPYFIAKRGGYFNLPDKFFNEFPPTAFYIYDNKELIPTREDVGEELSKYVDAQIEYCLDFSSFKGYEIEISSSKTSSIIGKNNIEINMELPITIKKGDTVQKLNDFQIFLNENRLAKSIVVANNITKQISNNPENLCFTCIFNVANQNDFDLIIDSYDESTYLFQLNDKASNKDFTLNFAIKLVGYNE